MTWQTSPTDASTAILVDDKRNVAVVYERTPGAWEGVALDERKIHTCATRDEAESAVEGAVAAGGAK